MTMMMMHMMMMFWVSLLRITLCGSEEQAATLPVIPEPA